MKAAIFPADISASKRWSPSGGRIGTFPGDSVRDNAIQFAHGHWVTILDGVGIPAERLDGRGHPCPKCGGRDRFAAFADVAQRGAVHCRRCFTAGCPIRPGSGLATLQWYLEMSPADAFRVLRSAMASASVTAATQPRASRAGFAHESPSTGQLEHSDTIARMTRDAARCESAMRPSWYGRLAKRLHVDADALRNLAVGFCRRDNAVTFPMGDGDGQIIGLRLRDMQTGAKWSRTGSRAGVFELRTVSREAYRRVFLAEGPTDTAALASLGLATVGRPAARGGMVPVLRWLQRFAPSEVVVVGDRDDAGRDAAWWWRSKLANEGWISRVIFPPSPYADIRHWMQGGATAAAIEALADRATIEHRRWLF